MFRILLLLKIHLFSFVHRLRHDFIRELIVGLCSLVLLGLFYYIFDDFLNSELAKLSMAMRDRFAEVLAWGLLLGGAFSIGRWCRTFYAMPSSLVNRIEILGERPGVIRVLGVFHVFLLFMGVYGPLWWFVDTVLVAWMGAKTAVVFSILLLVSLGSWLMKERGAREGGKLSMFAGSPLLALVQWRLWQIFFRNRITQFCLGLSLLFMGISFLVGVAEIPFVAVFGSSFMVGFLGACALAFQYSDDVQYGWVEKSLGVSHRLYMHNLTLTATILALLLAVCNAFAWCIGAANSDAGQFFDQGLRAFAVTFIPVWMVPFALFQIDARRAALTILLTFLSGIFAATAVYATWFSLLLMPLIVYYGYQSQEGRFYRA
ncbi:MAG: hypothetical protein HYW48_11415 [Deltaproteobacteria bacterium]|nr:hypothetical protein [Deltaproteobacteria bacterium]